MADPTEYIEAFNPGADVTFSVGAGGARAGRVVEINGSRTVTETAGASAKVAGVSARTAKEGESVVVKHGKWQRLIAAGAIAAGDRVASASQGRVASATSGATIGLAIAAAADGATVLVRLDQ
jgi:hypothetical protein